MDLSIRVIAFNTCATNVAPHQGTHTYRLSKFLKINTATPKNNASSKEAELSYTHKLPSRRNCPNQTIPSPGTRGYAGFQLPGYRTDWHSPSGLQSGCGGRI
ncbi:MAG: hypothetical protein HZT41_15155 [Dechloromonas sp.]|nr:MAG: hypothetical protein HZT41_15155 [Dechloromonas sp.]